MDVSPRSGARAGTLPTGTVSFLFTDIQGSTELLHKLGDQPYGEVLLTHQRLLRQAFAEHEGAEVDTQGDAFFVAFPRAWNAIGAAVAAQQALASHPWPDGVRVQVRMGIHTGEPTLAGDHYVGLDVHRAARIAATGYGGQVLLSERSYAMAQGSMPAGVEVRDLGEHRLKDIHRPEHIYQLVIPGQGADFPPLKSLEILVTNLPSLQLTSFVGRERQMEEIKTLLGSSRLLTLLGPGGTGKTRLALQVAGDLLAEFPRGVWLVELAPLSDPETVVPTAAAAFNVREAPSRPLLESLIDYLKPRELLLLLDNCEHLVEAAAHLADAILRTCPKVRLLATSRAPLGVHGETTYRVPPLTRPDPAKVLTADQLGQFEAARLFIERALISNPQFMATDRNAFAVARVVHRLDGIPLAIELAAARVKVLSVEQIAARLDDRFRLLTTGARVGVPHHQTLRATIDWSHELLSVPERVLFRRLAVFAGGFSLEAAERVGAGGEIDELDVLDLLARLVDKSLLVTEELDGDVRYRLLETIREYGKERLAASGEEAEVRGRHLRWHLALAEQAEPHLRGPEQITWLDRLELDHDDLRAALDWSATSPEHAGAAMRLAASLHRFWVLRGHLGEGRQHLEATLARGAGVSAELRAQAGYAAAVLAFAQGDYARADALARESLEDQRARRDHIGTALSLNVAGTVARNRGDYQQAAALLEESLALSRQANQQWAMAEALNILGVIARRQRDLNRAKMLLEESLALWRQLGDKWGLAFVLGHLGVVARYQGNYERSRLLHAESLALRRELGDMRDTALALVSLGVLALDQGDHAQARSRFEESLALSRELGDKVETAAALGNLGITMRYLGEYRQAEALLDESLACYRELGDKLHIASALANLGVVVQYKGDEERAASLYKEALAMFAEQSDKLGIADCLSGLAMVAGRRGRPERALRLFAAAEGLREAMGTPLPPSDRAEHDDAVAAVRGLLDPAAFKATWEAGRGTPLEQTIQEALGD
jgi:predicted ATPase/class 3 adenylate cyclase